MKLYSVRRCWHATFRTTQPNDFTPHVSVRGIGHEGRESGHWAYRTKKLTNRIKWENHYAWIEQFWAGIWDQVNQQQNGADVGRDLRRGKQDTRKRGTDFSGKQHDQWISRRQHGSKRLVEKGRFELSRDLAHRVDDKLKTNRSKGRANSEPFEVNWGVEFWE